MKNLYSLILAFAGRALGLVLAIFVLVGQVDAQCNQTIVPDTLMADYRGNSVGFCVDLDFMVAIRSDRYIDGVLQTGFAEGCDFDSLVYYPYATFPDGGTNGPYELINWAVDGSSLNVMFSDVNDLVNQMNNFNSSGNWINEQLTRNIVGGENGRTYSPMIVQQMGSGTQRSVNPNISRVANGTLVVVDGAGFHEYVIDDPSTGCRDTLTLFLRPILEDIELEIFTDYNQESQVFCLDNSGLLGSPQAVVICDAPDDGTLNDQGGYCYTYTPDAGQTGSDVICIEVCDDSAPPIGPICQRTIVTMITRSPTNLTTDTVRFTMTNVDTTVCVNAVLDLGAMADFAEVCGPIPTGLNILPSTDGCVDILPEPSFSGPAVVCVSHCIGAVCDTTILDFTVLSACDLGLFPNTTDTIPSQGNPTPYCLSVERTQLNAYSITVDGLVYNGPVRDCDFEQQYFYNYAPLFGNGGLGPYTLTSWTFNGQDFSTTFQDPTELETFMRATDPAGNWSLDAGAFNIIGGEPNSSYGTMIIVHDGTGTRSELLANPIDIAQGASIELPGDGNYVIEVTNPSTGCIDAVTLTVGQTAPPTTVTQTLNVNVFADSVSQTTCLFTNPRDQFSICEDVSNGTTSFDVNDCVVYRPNPGFTGMDTLCVVSCDLPAGVVCDTTFAIFNVIPQSGTITQTLNINVIADSVSQLTCLFTNPRDQFSICGDVSNGTTTYDLNDCVVYRPDPGFTGMDTLCVVSCDLPAGVVCDTTFAIFNVVPQTTVDTIYLTNFGDAPFNLCNGLPISGPFSSVSICGVSGPFTAAISPDGQCVVADPDDGVAGTGEICVTFCSTSMPVVCQEVLFIITQTPSCAPSLFAQDTVTLPSSFGDVEYCLANGTDLSNYEIYVNGALTTPTTDPSCGGGGGGGADVYFYPLLFINDGPLRIDAWDINGNTILNVATSGFAELADTMSFFDPGNNWTYDVAEQGLVGTSNVGNYSQLILFDMSFGTTYTIPIETIQSGGGGGGGVDGSVITLQDPGIYDVEVIALDGSCGDRLVIHREGSTSPDLDTVIFAATSDQLNGPYCLDVAELGTTPTSIQSCGDPMNGTVIFDNLECLSYQPNPGFIGSDTACVVICTNGGLLCDTTTVIFNVTDNSACPEIWAVTTASATTDDCTALTNVCLPAFPDEFFNYSVSVDGVVQAGALACGADTVTIYSYADVAGQGQAGPYRIEGYNLSSGTFTENLGDINVLVDSLNQWDPNGNWMINPSNFTIFGGVSGFPYDTIDFRQIATDTLNRLVPVTTLIENQIGFDLPVGSYSIGVTDLRTNCTDTLRYNVICTTGNDCPDITPANGTDLTLVDCDGTTAFEVLSPVTDPSDLEIYVDGVQVSFTANASSAFVFLGEGTFDVNVVDPTRSCASTFTVNVVCGPCPGPIPTNVIGAGVDCSATDLEICLPASPDVLQAYAITIDGQAYTGALGDCDEVLAFVLDAFEFPDGGAAGPYTIDSFRINGQLFTTDVTTIGALADTLSNWDATGMWRFDAAEDLLLGGNPQSVYSDLFVTQISSGVQAQVAISQQSVAQATVITIPSGATTRMLTFDNGVDCIQEVTLMISCTSNSTASDTIPVLGDVLFCVDDSELSGPIVSLENICPDPLGAATFDFDGQLGCVTAMGITPGSVTACLVACDASGVCDTTFYTVIVTPDGSGGLDAVDDNIRIRLDQVGTISVTGNDTFDGALSSISIVEQPTRGTALLDNDGTLTYTPPAGECGFTDSLTYQICQGVICDRAFVLIDVRCEPVEAYTGFSPNGDGINDQLRFIGLEDYPSNTLTVYNRWGNEVYVTENYQNDWEGTWEDKLLIDGTYFWQLELEGEDEPVVGYVQIHR